MKLCPLPGNAVITLQMKIAKILHQKRYSVIRLRVGFLYHCGNDFMDYIGILLKPTIIFLDLKETQDM